MISSYKAIPVNADNKSRVIREMSTHPLRREVLLNDSSRSLDLPIMAVHSMQVQPGDQQTINDWGDLSDTISNKEPTFDGEANISEEII